MRQSDSPDLSGLGIRRPIDKELRGQFQKSKLDSFCATQVVGFFAKYHIPRIVQFVEEIFCIWERSAVSLYQDLPKILTEPLAKGEPLTPFTVYKINRTLQ
jgi:hypothetical protein